jgi:hypothetical protein
MKMMSRPPLHFLAACGLLFVPAWAAADYPIAGLTPDQRPAGAPSIQEVSKGPDWFAQALQGVDKPYPASLQFLEDQGNWHTPFNRPGMPPPYDIRHWHTVKK